MQNIQITQDHSLFKRIPGNRKINQAHVNRLIRSLENNATASKYTPIIVNENHEIIDGQHRLEALKELGLPVHYVVEKGLNLSDVQALNSLSKPWSPMDFARSFAEIGNQNYVTYIAFKEEFKLNHDILQNYLSLDDGITTLMFKTGRLKVKDETKSRDLCKKLIGVGAYFEHFNRRSFAFAFKRMWENPEYEHKHFLERMESKGHTLSDFALPEDCLREMEKIYNKNLHAKYRVRFF